MGVPAFYRWLSSRYPKSIVLCDEEEPAVVDGVEIPVDYTKDSPNGHVDNLYLDMNGIIHPCFHPENKAAPLTFEECFKDIFEYIDRILAIVRPRKLLYMAVDGVAPRAKMNQQRARRFKTAKESKDKLAEEKRIREEFKAQGMNVREMDGASETTELSDSNIITPGTEFMAKLSAALQYYIHQRINTQPAWKSLIVMLSDASVPGEGEHKIMEYIHLIHLALATHEPHFHILREVVFGAPAGDDPEGGAKPKVPYQYLKISILREYLALEFNDVRLRFAFDKERIYDDFVFLCFFVGNDFLPHSPTLEIREGGIDLLMCIYKRQLPFLGGYLTNGAKVHLKRVETIIREVARCEERILQKRMRILKNQESKRKSAVKRPMSVAVPSPYTTPAPSIRCKGTPKKQKTEEEDTTPESSSGTGRGEEKTPVDAKRVWEDLMSVSPKAKAENILAEDSHSETEKEKNEVEEMVKSTLKTSAHEKSDMFDSMVQHGEAVGFGVAGWKERYYRMKFPDVPEAERRTTVKDMVVKFVEGLAWVMSYYYEGVASWTWYYPYHYAPFASDMIDIARIRLTFELGEPFLPVNQLMAVLPADSRFCLPKCLQHLFVDVDSPIIDFYPEDFQCDMNGKRFAWQAVVLLPFINENRLIETTKYFFNSPGFLAASWYFREYFSEFTEEEKERNKRKITQCYVSERHPLSQFIKDSISEDSTSAVVKLEVDPARSDGLNGFLCVSKKYCPESMPAPFGIGEDIEHNRVCMGSFLNPPHQTHLCQLMQGAQDEATGVTIYDVPPEQPMWHEHPRAGNNPPTRTPGPRPQFAIDRDAAHRFVVHSFSEPRFRVEAPQRSTPQRSTLRASAPEFIPENVTRMAMQMTGQLGGGLPHFVQPPLVPPENVTDAAIKLSERARGAHVGADFRAPGMQPMNPAIRLSELARRTPGEAHIGAQGMRPMTPAMQPPTYFSYQQSPHTPMGFQPYSPHSPMNISLQPQIRGPEFFAPRPQMHEPGNLSPQQQQQTPYPRPDPSGNPRPERRGGDRRGERKRKM